MIHRNVPRTADLDKLREFDACTISNAIERLNVRMRNEGFVSGDVHCQFPSLPPMMGYAATCRIRTASPPMSHRCYYDRPDWWRYVDSLPEPRVLVLQDVDHRPGLGAFVGEIHAAIGKALKCVGCVTNGSVRDLPAVEATGFQMFARGSSVSHAYAHVIEFGGPAEIGGVKISSEDLLFGDQNGVVTIPVSNTAEVIEEASKIRQEERELIRYCHSSGFTLQELVERIQNMNLCCDLPWERR